MFCRENARQIVGEGKRQETVQSIHHHNTPDARAKASRRASKAEKKWAPGRHAGYARGAAGA